jgi:hypothetical protein
VNNFGSSSKLPEGVRIVALYLAKCWGYVPSISVTTVQQSEKAAECDIQSLVELVQFVEGRRWSFLDLTAQAWDAGGLLRADLEYLLDQCCAVGSGARSVLEIQRPNIRLANSEWSVIESNPRMHVLEYTTPPLLRPFWILHKNMEIKDAECLIVSFSSTTMMGEGGGVTLYKDTSCSDHWGTTKTLSGDTGWPGVGGERLLFIPASSFHLVIEASANPLPDHKVEMKIQAPLSRARAKKLRAHCKNNCSLLAAELALLDARNDFVDAKDMLLTAMQE